MANSNIQVPPKTQGELVKAGFGAGLVTTALIAAYSFTSLWLLVYIIPATFFGLQMLAYSAGKYSVEVAALRRGD